MTETGFWRDLVQFSSSGLALTPERLESAIAFEQMADLLAFQLLPR